LTHSQQTEPLIESNHKILCPVGGGHANHIVHLSNHRMDDGDHNLHQKQTRQDQHHHHQQQQQQQQQQYLEPSAFENKNDYDDLVQTSKVSNGIDVDHEDIDDGGGYYKNGYLIRI
jgi:hypothetical protein